VRIRVVTPVTASEFGEGAHAIRDILEAARSDDHVDHVQIEHGPASIENEYEEAMAVPDTLRCIVEAERDGIDGVVINCMGDPGLYAARQLVSIPVVGPYQAAGHMACTLGHRFSVVTVLDSVVPMFWDRAAVYGFRSSLASVRVVDIAVLDLEANRDRMTERIVEEAAVAVREDGADTIVFGCTGMAGVAQGVAEQLRARGLDVPVIDPAPAALKLCEVLVDMRLRQSRRAFPTPGPKAMPGYPDLLALTRTAG
jgi:allantoin racemase